MRQRFGVSNHVNSSDNLLLCFYPFGVSLTPYMVLLSKIFTKQEWAEHVKLLRNTMQKISL